MQQVVTRVTTMARFLEELERLGVDDFAARHRSAVLVVRGDAGGPMAVTDMSAVVELPPLGEQGCTVGRSASADVTLPMAALSKRHVLLRADGARGFILEDLGSKNGTFVAGRQLRAGERCPLADGASFHLGGHELTLHSADGFADLVAALSGESTGSRPERVIVDDRGGSMPSPSRGPRPPALTGTIARRSIQGRLEVELEELVLTNENGLEAVIEVSRYLGSIRSLDELLEKILESVVRVMGAERGALLALEDDGDGVGFRCITARGLSPENVVEGSNEISFGIIREAHNTGEAILTDNALVDERFKERMSVMATVIRSVLCGPIRTRARTLGFVYLDRRITAVPFDENHRDLLAALCTQVAVAWENALAFEEIEGLNASLEQKVEERTRELVDTRLKLAEAERDKLEAEMTLARQIQQSILPAESTHTRPGLRVCGRVIPASFCGGDFWWIAEMGDKTLLLIADVTGHGVAASMITAVAAACLDTLADGHGKERSVGEVLETLNRVVYRSAGGRLCATAFCAIYDPAENRLDYAGAGHNFPYLLGDADDLPAPLLARGARLGEAKERSFDEKRVYVRAGHRLVLFSDGLVEWHAPDGRLYGDRRFRKSLQTYRQVPVEEAIDRYIADAEAFAAGVERDDDLSIVVVDFV